MVSKINLIYSKLIAKSFLKSVIIQSQTHKITVGKNQGIIKPHIL